MVVFFEFVHIRHLAPGSLGLHCDGVMESLQPAYERFCTQNGVLYQDSNLGDIMGMEWMDVWSIWVCFYDTVLVVT
jgi:hypothetical protein